MPQAPDAWETMVRAVWHADPSAAPTRPVLERSLALARRNGVDGAFIRAYAHWLPGELVRLEATVGAYRANLATACELLDAAGVAPILIKSAPRDDLTYSNFDLVVGDDEWSAAVDALQPWVVRVSRHPLERATKLLLYPVTGPAVHLHRAVAWFDVPAIPTQVIRRRATPADGVACLLPGPVDALRIQLAHAVFQDQSLSLAELRAIRGLLTPTTIREARGLAMEEGWARGFDEATELARRSADRLDRLEAFPLPARLSVLGGIVTGFQHAGHLARSGRWAIAVREVALRAPLVAAKQRRLRFA